MAAPPLVDHEFLIRKPVLDVTPAQAFTAATAAGSSLQTDTIHALQQLASHLGFQLQPASGTSTISAPQVFYTNRSSPPNSNRGRGDFHSRGRGSHDNNFNRNRGGNRNPGQFSWASNQNTVYGSCNRCGIGHVPSQCPNRDPSTFRTRQPFANYTDSRS